MCCFLWIAHTLWPSKEGTALELSLPRKTKEVRKEVEAWCKPWLRVCSPGPREAHGWQVSSRDTFRAASVSFIYLGFQQPSLFKKPSLFFFFLQAIILHLFCYHSEKKTTTFHSWFCIVSKLQNLVIIISYHLDQLLLHFSYLPSFHHQYNPSDSAKFLLLVSPTYFWLISTSFG